MRRKILMGVLALALPAGLLAATTGTALAKLTPDPTSCTGFGGTVTFGTPLSPNGVPTSAKDSLATTVSGGSFTCSVGGASFTGLTIAGSKNPKLAKTDPNYNKTTGVKYLTGTKSAFEAAGGSLKKTLKFVNFTINGHAEQFKTKSATEVVGAPCTGEVGFQISGQVKAAPYDTKTAVILACLGTDTGTGTSGSLGVDLFNSSTVNTAQIDPAFSTATL